jgi:cation diffusion facilitator family transporter
MPHSHNRRHDHSLQSSAQVTKSESAPATGVVRYASYISLAVSILLLAAKLWAYRQTHSQAVFSDAMESIVNVVAALLAMIVLSYARKPADSDHPYGHGKAEFFSAAFEGGLIAFAAVSIIVEAVQALIEGRSVNQLGIGVAVILVTGIFNAALGFYLRHVGRKHHSSALEASGDHVLSDFFSSAGVVVGLILVWITQRTWIDSAVAVAMGAYLAVTGVQLVRRSLGGLLDAEDRDILANLMHLFADRRRAGIIQLHHLRVIRSGHFHHIDAHAVVPEFWNVLEAHDRTEAFEAELMREYNTSGELHLHVDPCRRAYCRVCDVADCSLRCQEFVKYHEPSLQELTSPDEPAEFRVRSGTKT